MNEILEEFKIVFGFDDKPLQEGVKKTSSTLKGLGKVFGSLMASYVSFQSLKAITVDYANFNVELGESTSLLGLNAEEVSALGGALERFGGNTDSAVSSIKSLSGHLEQAKRGQGALLEVSRKYGLRVNPFASATDTLKSLGSQMGRFTNQQRLAISQQLGLDESLTRAFADGGKELDKYIQKQKELGTTTQEDIDLSNKFSNAQLDLKDVFGALTRDFARVILPAFTRLVELFSSFIEWVRNHKQLVVIFFGALLIAMTPILIMLGKMAIASAVAFAPILKTVAIITVISLILEDIYGYFMGWDSVTGDLVKEFPVIGTILEYIRPIVIGIADTFGAIVDWLKNPSWKSFGKIFKTAGGAIVDFIKKPLREIKDVAKAVWDTFVGWVQTVDNFITSIPIIGTVFTFVKDTIRKVLGLFGKIIDFVSSPLWDGFVDVFKSAGTAIVDFIMKPLDTIKATIKELFDWMGELGDAVADKAKALNPMNWFGGDDAPTPAVAPAVPYRASTMNNQANNYKINNNFNQNISTATPTQFANQTNAQIADSIYNVRQQNGAL